MGLKGRIPCSGLFQAPPSEPSLRPSVGQGWDGTRPKLRNRSTNDHGSSNRFPHSVKDLTNDPFPRGTPGTLRDLPGEVPISLPSYLSGVPSPARPHRFLGFRTANERSMQGVREPGRRRRRGRAARCRLGWVRPRRRSPVFSFIFRGGVPGPWVAPSSLDGVGW